MSQHDYTIANQGFPATRADINNALSAIATNNSGTSAPSTQYAGQFWIDTTSSTWTLYIHDGADDIQFATIDTSANTVNFVDSALDVVTDTTPQLGGNLDLNSNDITGTGNINITGTGTFSGDLTVDTNTLKVDSANNRVGIGTSSPETKLHVFSASSGASAHVNGDDLFIENSGHCGITIGSGATSVGTINFADSSAQYDGYIEYGHNGSYMRFATAVSTSGEAMRIDSSGNVGIGTSTPTARFDTRISTLTGKVAEFHNSGGYGIDLTVESNSGVNTISSGNTQGLAFATNGSSNERMRIDSSGNVLINTTSVLGSGYLHIEGQGKTYCAVMDSDSVSGGFIGFEYNNVQVGSITTNGTTTAYVTSSDYRLKENVNYDFDATTRLKQLKPARFNFIADADTTVDGFLAHEVSDIVPEAITGTKDETETKEKVVINANGGVIAENIEQADWEAGKIPDENGNTKYPTDSTWEATKVVPVYQGIDQAKLVPLLVKTIQELEARITALETTN